MNKKSKQYSKESRQLMRPDFLSLQRSWYAQIAQSGFKDIEEYDERRGSLGVTFLKRTCKSLATKYNQSTFEYYQTCRDFLAHGEFQSALDYRIWELYSDGTSLRKIITTLKSEPQWAFKYSVFWLVTQLKRIKVQLYLWCEKQGLFIEEED